MKARSILLLLVSTVLTTLQSRCVQLGEVDSTHSPAFATMIGREFELKEEFLVRGVKLPPKFDQVNYALIMPPPGIYSKYRIVDLGHFDAGSRFKIVGVVTRHSELFPSTEYVIAFADRSFDEVEGQQVRITAASSWKLYVKPDARDAAPQLSERYFHPVEKSSR